MEETLLKSISLTSIKHLVIVLILVPVLLFVACTSNQSASNGNTSVPVTSAVGYQIKFFFKGQQLDSLGLTELRSLPEVTIEIGSDTPATGPTLQSVLELAGIKEYAKVTVIGLSKGRIATAEVTLQKTEITGDVVLDFNNQGKTKLCGVQIPQDKWIIDVSEIRVE